MDREYSLYALARALRRGAESLLEASEHASELKRFELSTQLLDQGAELLKLHKETLEVPF